MEKRLILSSVVGSQAHGLATPESDWDYRGVFVVPTSQLLSVEQVGNKPETVSWLEGREDDTSYELGHFLKLATKCNPTILEVFVGPIDPRAVPLDVNDERRLRELFPLVWNSRGVLDSFRGYGLNQRKKFLDDKDNRARKYAVAYIRSLYCGYKLLTTGEFCVNVGVTEVGEKLRRFKRGEYESIGEVIDEAVKWEKQLEKAYEENPDKHTDYDAVNDFLLDMRKKYWD